MTEKQLDMMKTNFTQKKIINILSLILILLTSCTSLKKNNKSDDVKLTECLDDYINNYSKYHSDDSLVAIIIRTKVIDNKDNFIIDDAPKSIIYGALNELKNNNANTAYKIGIYRGVLCQFYNKSFNNYINIFSDLDLTTIQDANSSQVLTDQNGKSIKVDLSLTNWDPNIEVVYKVFDNKKEINIIKRKKILIRKIIK